MREPRLEYNRGYVRKPIRAKRRFATITGIEGYVDDLYHPKPQIYTIDPDRLEYALQHAHEHPEGEEPMRLMSRLPAPEMDTSVKGLLRATSEVLALWLHHRKRKLLAK